MYIPAKAKSPYIAEVVQAVVFYISPANRNDMIKMPFKCRCGCTFCCCPPLRRCFHSSSFHSCTNLGHGTKHNHKHWKRKEKKRLLSLCE